MFLNMWKILNWLKAKVKKYAKILYYIIETLESKMQCLNNTTNNNCTIFNSREYKNICQEPTYKYIALKVLVWNNNSLACNNTVEQRNSLRYKRF